MFSNGLKGAPTPNGHSASGRDFHFEVQFRIFHCTDGRK